MDTHVSEEWQGMYQVHGKRLLDLALTIPVLVLSAPLMAGVAILIRLKLGTPVLFRQERAGLGGSPFVLVKFRTMKDQLSASGQLLPDEQRMTNLGRFLRSTSLDELPTLWNVVRGQMGLGPRPLLLQYLPRYTPEQMRRHEVRPGVTGLAQVRGRNALCWEQKFALDVRYVDSVSFALDAAILARTVWCTFARRGIAQEGRVTADEFMGGAESSRESV
jgi:lipopolysaccharide/colanic/teichoic acid biosynthesis glycosyltransferase